MYQKGKVCLIIKLSHHVASCSLRTRQRLMRTVPPTSLHIFLEMILCGHIIVLFRCSICPTSSSNSVSLYCTFNNVNNLSVCCLYLWRFCHFLFLFSLSGYFTFFFFPNKLASTAHHHFLYTTGFFFFFEERPSNECVMQNSKNVPMTIKISRYGA